MKKKKTEFTISLRFIIVAFWRSNLLQDFFSFSFRLVLRTKFFVKIRQEE